MYESFFHLKKNPFGMTPDPSCMLMTPSHREALSALLYAIFKRKGFVVLSGDAGTGKTTLLRALIQSETSAHFSVIPNPTLNIDDFLELMLFDFGVHKAPPSKARRIIKLQDLLSDMHERGKVAVLIVDEAHKASPELLEEIRLLTNFETTDQKLLQIVMAGQPELSRVLDQHNLRQLKQRIELRLELKPLSTTETGVYMQHRWSRAGGTTTPLPFAAETVLLIAQASQGIPRFVNSICDNSLSFAYDEGAAIVTTKHVSQALSALHVSQPGRVTSRVAPLAAKAAWSQ